MVFQLWLIYENIDYIKAFNKTFKHYRWGSDMFAYSTDPKFIPQMFSCVKNGSNWILVLRSYSDDEWLASNDTFADATSCMDSLIELKTIPAVSIIPKEING